MLPLLIALLTAPPVETDSMAEAKHLANIRQVTSGLPRAGEGYFSPSGDTIVYQAYPVGYPFYQIYVQKLDEKTPRLLSTGRGRTTCAYFNPRGDKIIFASSHTDPKIDETELAAREEAAKGGRRRYQWDFDPHMELYITDFPGETRASRQVAINKSADSKVSQRGRKLAVVVGINEYRPNQGLNNLSQAINDASRLSETLRQQGFVVVEMTHEAASKPGKAVLAPNADYIRDQIETIVDTPNLGAGDTVLICLHGHGAQFDSDETVVENGKEQTRSVPRFFFCPADSGLEGVAKANDLTERNHLIALDELYQKLQHCTAATKILIVDACRNDPSRVRTRTLSSVTRPKLPPPPGGIAAFFSCKANEEAIEDPDLKQGVFTHFLIKGLQGKADQPLDGKPADGVITLAEITTYVSNNTFSYVAEKYAGRKQSPDIKGEFDTTTPLTQVVNIEEAVNQSKAAGKGLKRLTDSPGYDAEGSFSSDGKQIVFTSSRDGDPDLYVMDADGSNVRQLTNTPGYDGGPFFSPDGKWVIFRSDRQKEHMLQLFAISVDGKTEVQLTNNLEQVNWCPYFHPSGKYLVWSGADYSKGPTSAHFNLYTMDLDWSGGTLKGGEVQQITHSSAADVLPVFSPDGKSLMWTSTRTPDGTSQLWIADWLRGRQ